MAMAGWLMIGVALLILIAVMNNSWEDLITQFQQRLGQTGSGGFNASPGGQLGGSLGSQTLVPPLSQQPRDNATPDFPGRAGGTGGEIVQAPGGGAPTA